MPSGLTDRLGRPVKHGMHKSPEYRAWQKMKDRCFNPKSQRFDRYGKRGITVCPEWASSFEAFYAHVGPRPSSKHSIERKNNDGNYEPSNVVWATHAEQDNNKCINRVLTFDGRTQTLSQWASETGIPFNTLKYRLNIGWNIEKAMTTPVEKRIWTSSSGNRISTVNRQKIISLQNSGRSKASIAREFGISESAVRKIWRSIVSA